MWHVQCCMQAFEVTALIGARSKWEEFMKRYGLLAGCLSVFAIGIGGCASTYSRPYRPEQVQASAGFDYFYDALSPYGTWVNRDPYGWVWCPLDISAGWRPLTVGSWAYTDWGWMWISEDPWGSLPYQYGRWAYDDIYGWIWVPGDVWAPAWVAWHYGNGWVGWAPLPPEATWQAGIGFTSAPNFDASIDSYNWCFVPAPRFATANIRGVVVPPSRNATLLSLTKNVTNYSVQNSRPAERGLSVDLIEREVGSRIRRYQVVDTGAPRGGWRPVVRGTTIEVHRPAVAPTATDDRLRSAPPGRLRSRPPSALVTRQETEDRRLEQQMAQERAELQREHDRELRNPPQGIAVEALRQRHAAEMLAQQERERRERDLLRRRWEELRKQSQSQGQSPTDQEGQKGGGNDQDQDHGRGRGHDHGRGQGGGD